MYMCYGRKMLKTVNGIKLIIKGMNFV